MNTTTITGTVTAREYARSSKGKGGRSKSTDDQHTENLAAMGGQGWTEGGSYADTDSAYDESNPRDDFNRLIADLESGRFGAPGTVLVLWEISRLARRIGKGNQVVKLLEAAGHRVHVTSHGRTYDPSNYNDWDTLITGIKDAEKESRLLSSRTQRGVQSNVTATDDQGEHAARPHGTCPFGFKRDYAMVDGRMRPVRQYEDPEEAPLIRDLFARILAGDSFKSIERDWAELGVTGRRGRPFIAATLRDMATGIHYVGLRASKGEAVKASWPALVPEDTFYAVQRILADPSRRSRRDGGAKHVLTAALRCNECSGPITVRTRRVGKRRQPAAYECMRGCVRLAKEGVDAEVIGTLLAYLARPELYAAISADDTDDSESAAIRTELARRRSELAELEAAETETLAEARIIAKAVETQTAKIRELEARQRDLAQPSRISEIFPADADKDVAKRWADLPLTARRELAALLLTPELLGEVWIKRSPSPGILVPAADRIIWSRA